MYQLKKPVNEGLVPKEVLDRARPYRYEPQPKEVRLDMLAYAGPGVVGFMKPGQNFVALDFEGRIPYGNMGQGPRAVREHELMHHKFHDYGIHQDERRINRLVAQKLGLHNFPFASY